MLTIAHAWALLGSINDGLTEGSDLKEAKGAGRHNEFDGPLLGMPRMKGFHPNADIRLRDRQQTGGCDSGPSHPPLDSVCLSTTNRIRLIGLGTALWLSGQAPSHQVHASISVLPDRRKSRKPTPLRCNVCCTVSKIQYSPVPFGVLIVI